MQKNPYKDEAIIIQVVTQLQIRGIVSFLLFFLISSDANIT